MPRAMEIVTPLGDDVLLFHGMHGREELGRASEYRIDLLSTRSDIDLDEVLGQNVTVKLALPHDATRYFNGFVTRFAQHGTLGRYQRYHATIRPWLWFLTRTADCRIFQDKTVPDIVQEVFGDHTTADVAVDLTGSYRTWNYCVQYRETDFNFVSRLLEHEGLYYYFRHTEGHNTLALTDSASQHAAFPGYEDLPFLPPGRTVRTDREHVSRWEFSREIQPGVYVHDDYDLERPTVELRTRRTLERGYAPSDYEVYDYPGGYLQTSDGEQYANVRIEEFGAGFELAQAATNARGVAVGCSFNLTDHPRGDQNREYLVVAASYDLDYSGYEGLPNASDAARFGCRFTAMSTAEQFRPRRVTPKPFVQGPQTAVVVGPAGEEIYTDNYGRVKVQFHWDRYGGHDENSSCWMRVAQPWAGKGWGTVSTPRIGHEVLVEFLEGDPDQPIVVGSVHNADNMPPHTAHVSGIKSNTHKGRGYNQMTMDDTAGKEKVTIHAQYDMNTTVEHDQTVTVNGGNRTVTVKAGTLTETVKGDASLTVQAGSRTVSVTGGDYSAEASDAVVLHGKGKGVSITGDAKGVSITGNGEGVSVLGNGKGVSITGNGQGVDILGNGQGVQIEGNGGGVGITGNGKGVNVTGTPHFFAEGTANAGIKAPIVDIGDAEVNIVGSKITISAGAASIVLDAGGVTIQGPLVKTVADPSGDDSCHCPSSSLISSGRSRGSWATRPRSCGSSVSIRTCATC
jgi:type VI secretion system secreted protein VgrG